MTNNIIRQNQKGVTLIELLISIVVGSIVISMLMSILVMSVKAKASFDSNNKVLNESYIIAEYIQFQAFELGTQEIELIEDSGLRTEIHLTHLYEITTDVDNVIIRDYGAPNPIIDILIYDKVTEQITYNGELIHSSNVFMTVGSSIELISIDDIVCDLSIEPCEQGIIKLTLNITVQLSGGGFLSPKEFVTTIII